ncbi:tail collar protein [Thioclava dalianensis]|uniref:Tail collar protein n=1 Tax=Thioclava dalianensis TaxID=1185766 RepID=A0A074TDY7_9RHOB|nr:tail fiber protein [Thioclava dalianensis]KEP69986.1 tail collar protein [Thioclava dalianensis]SFN18731.1 Microcystin-dependent protein [Thioclava dalianensis]
MEPFLGMVMPVAFNYAPTNWALCNGQLMQISQNQALFALLGNRFGGDGRSTFALPDLRGRAARGAQSLRPGVMSGVETVTLTEAEMPSHTHAFNAAQDQISGRVPTPPDGKLVAGGTIPSGTVYGAPNAPVTLSDANISSAMGGTAHNNMQPFLTVNYIIALSGIFPSRS